MQAHHATSISRAFAARATRRVWYPMNPPEVAGLMPLAAAFLAQVQYHFQTAFHALLTSPEVDTTATALASGYIMVDGQV